MWLKPSVIDILFPLAKANGNAAKASSNEMRTNRLAKANGNEKAEASSNEMRTNRLAKVNANEKTEANSNEK